MFGKSGAGFTRRKTSVRSFFATTPGSACEFTYAAIAGAVVCPQLALRDLSSVLSGARCAVGVDTGLTHLAAALGVPTVGIYNATEPARTGLYGCARAVNVGGVARGPTVDEVIRALEGVL